MKGKDLVSTRGLARVDIESIFHTADEMLSLLKQNKKARSLEGKTVVVVFFCPSLRTHSFFMSAINRSGGSVINYGHLVASEIFRDETLYNAMRLLSAVGDGIVMRHPRDGSAALAAEAATVPLINAGDGANQHPASALTYAFELWKKNLLDGEIALVGRLKESRTVHSLLHVLSQFDCSLDLVSPEDQKLPAFMLNELRDSVKVRESTSFNPRGKKAVYMTRQQDIVSNQDIFSLPKDAVLLRKRRADEEVTAYAWNSIAVRMAVLKELLGD